MRSAGSRVLARYGNPEQLLGFAQRAAINDDVEKATRLWAAGDRLRYDREADNSQASCELNERFAQSLHEGVRPQRFAEACAIWRAQALAPAVAEELGVTDEVMTGLMS